MYHYTHVTSILILTIQRHLYTRSVKKIVIFGRELRLRHASVSKQKLAVDAALCFYNRASRGLN